MNHKVLLVEDNHDDIELAKLALRLSQVRIDLDIAMSGEEALAYLQTEISNARPELVLLDVKLPKISGLDVLRNMRASQVTREIPVMMLTTSDQPDDLQQAFQLGTNAYMCKPALFESLVIFFNQIAKALAAGSFNAHHITGARLTYPELPAQ